MSNDKKIPPKTLKTMANFQVLDSRNVEKGLVKHRKKASLSILNLSPLISNKFRVYVIHL